jgi:predicted RNA-binding Zn-ribbon protein involved in translation (DUF1610 family)
MHQWVMIFCLLALLSLLCFGCAWITKESSKGTAVRCPKCGDFFSSKEGLRRLSICEAVLRQGGSFAMSGWSRRGDLNPRPSDYESLALPLSYAGIKF